MTDIDLESFNKQIGILTNMRHPRFEESVKDFLPGILVRKYDGNFAILKVKHQTGQHSILLTEMMSTRGFDKIRGDKKSMNNIYYVAFDILYSYDSDVRKMPYLNRLMMLRNVCMDNSLIIEEQRSRHRGSSGRNTNLKVDINHGNVNEDGAPLPVNLCDRIYHVEWKQVTSSEEVWKYANEWIEESKTTTEREKMSVEGAVLTPNNQSLPRVKIKPVFTDEMIVFSNDGKDSVRGPRLKDLNGPHINVRNIPMQFPIGTVIEYKADYSTSGKRSTIFYRVRNDAYAEAFEGYAGSSSSSTTSSSSSSDSDSSTSFSQKRKRRQTKEKAKEDKNKSNKKKKPEDDPLAVIDIPLYAAYLDCLRQADSMTPTPAHVAECIKEGRDTGRLQSLLQWIDSKREKLGGLAPTGTQLFLELPRDDPLKMKFLQGEELHVRKKGAPESETYIIKIGGATDILATAEAKYGYKLPSLTCTCNSFIYGNYNPDPEKRGKAYLKDPLIGMERQHSLARQKVPASWGKLCKHIVQLVGHRRAEDFANYHVEFKPRRKREKKKKVSASSSSSDGVQKTFSATENQAIYDAYIQCLRTDVSIDECFKDDAQLLQQAKKLKAKLSVRNGTSFKTAQQLIYELPKDNPYRKHLESGKAVEVTGSSVYTLRLLPTPYCSCPSFNAGQPKLGNYITRTIASNDKLYKLPLADRSKSLPDRMRVCKHWQSIVNVANMSPTELMMTKSAPKMVDG